MIVDFDTLHNDTGHNALASNRLQRGDTQFATVMANACPLFSPWPAAEAFRSNTPMTSASLSTHPASSNRREGRHERE